MHLWQRLIAWGTLRAVHVVLWLWGHRLLPTDAARRLVPAILDGGLVLLGRRSDDHA